MKTILITGGAGFIGSHLSEALLEMGHKVVVMDNMITGSYRNINHLFENANFTCIKQDISEPLQEWDYFMDIEKLDYIVHLASPASPKHYTKYPIETLRANSYGTHNVLELAIKRHAVILVASTSEVYGEPEVHPQPETYYGNVNTLGIRACYDEGKRYMEAAVSTYARVYNLDTRIVRLFNTYGPRMCRHDGRVVSEFINNALEQQPLKINGDGMQTRSLCYVSDTVEGIIKALFSNYKGPINIGNIEEVEMLVLAHEITEMTNSESLLELSPATENDPSRRKPDISVAIKELAWWPKVNRAEGLAKTINYYKNEC